MKKLLSGLLVLCILLLSGCTGNSSEKTMTITVFEAGKADAVLITTDEGSILIDTGLDENSETLLSQLAERNIESLSALIITHFDKDHVGGADAVLDTLAVSRVYTTYQTKSSDEISEFEQSLKDAGLCANVISGLQKFSLGSAEVELYGASGSYEEDESNNSSLIVKIIFGVKTYLFMGDAQDERISEFLASGATDVDFLKVPYHGHWQKSLSELAETLSPKVSVITNGTDEPSEEEMIRTVSLLEKYGSVYRTSEGTVTITCKADSFSVSQ